MLSMQIADGGGGGRGGAGRRMSGGLGGWGMGVGVHLGAMGEEAAPLALGGTKASRMRS